MESINEKLKRVRRPRVHLTYDVETDGATIQKELPFVVGVLGDFSGNPSTPLQPLRERRFIQIDRDNFDDVMAKFAPELNIRVKNTLKDDGSDLALQLKFKSMQDFEPGKIVEQVPALKKMLDRRNELRELATTAERSEKLEGLLEEVLKNEEELKRGKGTLGGGDKPEEKA